MRRTPETDCPAGPTDHRSKPPTSKKFLFLSGFAVWVSFALIACVLSAGAGFLRGVVLAGAAFATDFFLAGSVFFEGLASAVALTFLAAGDAGAPVGDGGKKKKNGFLHFLQVPVRLGPN